MHDEESTLPSTMTAWAIDDLGGPEVFEKRETKAPPLNDHQVLAQEHATSVNPVDYKIHRGHAEGLCPSRPATVHGDVARVVAAPERA